MGENESFRGEGEAYLKQRKVELINLNNRECRELMQAFIIEKPDIW